MIVENLRIAKIDDADNEPVEEMLRGVGPFGESGESTRDGLTDLATKP